MLRLQKLSEGVTLQIDDAVVKPKNLVQAYATMVASTVSLFAPKGLDQAKADVLQITNNVLDSIQLDNPVTKE